MHSRSFRFTHPLLQVSAAALLRAYKFFIQLFFSRVLWPNSPSAKIWMRLAVEETSDEHSFIAKFCCFRCLTVKFYSIVLFVCCKRELFRFHSTTIIMCEIFRLFDVRIGLVVVLFSRFFPLDESFVSGYEKFWISKKITWIVRTRHVEWIKKSNYTRGNTWRHSSTSLVARTVSERLFLLKHQTQ